MHYIPYNSRLEYHKYPFGAVEENTAVTLRVILPRNLCCEGVKLLIRNDDGLNYTAVPMCWDCMEGEGEEWWRVEFTPPVPGIYRYSFEYYNGFTSGNIRYEGNGIGIMDSDGSEWQLTVYKKGLSVPGWVSEGIIYQIFPDRFYNSGSKKKNVPDDRIMRSDWGGEPMWEPDAHGNITRYDYFGGDLRGIEEKLPYLASLSVGCIYLNPIFESHSNHRYDTADYSRIDPLLGTAADFKSLCSTAKKLGIRIILDGVFSHTGADSKYFNIKKRYDTIGAYNSQQSEYYKWYKFFKWPDEYAGWWDIDILPETNEELPEFLNFITGKNGIARKWLRLGASGWRLDVADELPDTFLKNFYASVKAEKPDAYILGEVWEDATNKISYGHRRKYLLGEQMDSVMDYPLADGITDFLKTGLAERLMNTVNDIMENYPRPCVSVLMNHIGTHDTVRAITRLAGDDLSFKDRRRYSGLRLSKAQMDKGILLMKMASVLQFTMPGVPCVYYGDEAGLEGNGDPFNRACYPWGKENGELIEHYKMLGKLRKKCGALRNGKFIPISAAMGCIAYARTDGETSIIVIANRNEHDIVYKLQPRFYGANALTGGECINGSDAKIPACTAAILIL